MKRFYSFLLLAIIITSCSSAAPAPIAIAVPSTETPTLTPIIEPTATFTPTLIPMPKGWTSIAETKAIGGRQVVINEKGEGATQIDQEWYPVDVNGCYYNEFFDPVIQKNKPGIMELVEKINSEKSFSFGSDSPPIVRHWGGIAIGHISRENRPSITENRTDAIIFNQYLCRNEHVGEWAHVVDYVLPSDTKQMPNESMVMRGVVGWIRNSNYVSFTYLQQAIKEPLKLPNIARLSSLKATSLAEAFGLWQPLIDSQEQVEVGLPLGVHSKKDGTLTNNELKSTLDQLAVGVPAHEPYRWKDNLKDAEFMAWVLTDKNQIKYMADRKNTVDINITHMMTYWQYWGQQTSAGIIPEPTIRTITILWK